MELRHIRYFLAVAEERNFTKAAAKVGIGQPPLSQQIKDLEQEVGAPLFHRLARGAELTAAGQAFRDTVKDVPAQVAHAVTAAQRAARGEIGSLRVGVLATLAFNRVVPAAIRAFRRAYADVEVMLVEAATTAIARALEDGSLDAGFVRPGPDVGEGLVCRVVSEEPMIAVLPARHAAAKAGEVRLSALRDDGFVMFLRPSGQALYDSIVDACRKAGFEPKISQVAPQIASSVTLVAAGFGVAIVPASVRQLQIAGAVYRPLAGKAPIARLALAYRRGETSPVVRNFVAKATAS
jgi:DNA-binding transcriptional LysR family regulator